MRGTATGCCWEGEAVHPHTSYTGIRRLKYIQRAMALKGACCMGGAEASPESDAVCGWRQMIAPAGWNGSQHSESRGWSIMLLVHNSAIIQPATSTDFVLDYL